jgi:hypothetical protein
MLFGEAVAVYYENHTEHRDTVCGQSAKILCVEAGGTYSYLCDLDVMSQGNQEAIIRLCQVRCQLLVDAGFCHFMDAARLEFTFHHDPVSE